MSCSSCVLEDVYHRVSLINMRATTPFPIIIQLSGSKAHLGPGQPTIERMPRWSRGKDPGFTKEMGCFPMGVSKNSGTPKSSILIGFPLFLPSILGFFPLFLVQHPHGDNHRLLRKVGAPRLTSLFLVTR